jgi:hypothetical protein
MPHASRSRRESGEREREDSNSSLVVVWRMMCGNFRQILLNFQIFVEFLSKNILQVTVMRRAQGMKEITHTRNNLEMVVLGFQIVAVSYKKVS